MEEFHIERDERWQTGTPDCAEIKIFAWFVR